MKGEIIGGNFSEIIVRQKSGETLEIGELLVFENESEKMLFQVFDLEFASQLSRENIELVSGMRIEDGSEIRFFDEHTRNYILARIKSLITIRKANAKTSKRLPSFFGRVRDIEPEDVHFLREERNPLFLGNLRSGSKEIDFPIFINGLDAITHHILVSATTGKGKSNLVKSMLWNLCGKRYCGVLILDPHDEYYGRNSKGLRDHPESDDVVYYTPKDAPAGAMTLKISLASIKPMHLSGVLNLSEPQAQAAYAYFREYRDEWISAVVLEKPLPNSVKFHEETANVLRRNLIALLNLDVRDGNLSCHGIFSDTGGANTIGDIVSALEDARKVIIDTSFFSGNSEILIGSVVASEIFRKYRQHKANGDLDTRPAISIVLEEAPRVLGKAVLESGPNIFSTIAREGRKFKVGLLAITQLPSLIPREILANINTKVMLGMEMKPEREAMIDSAAQDLSKDDRNIASLDKGEAIVSSTFVRFATPIKIPLFEDVAREKRNEGRRSFAGIDILEEF